MIVHWEYLRVLVQLLYQRIYLTIQRQLEEILLEVLKQLDFQRGMTLGALEITVSVRIKSVTKQYNLPLHPPSSIIPSSKDCNKMRENLRRVKHTFTVLKFTLYEFVIWNFSSYLNVLKIICFVIKIMFTKVFLFTHHTIEKLLLSTACRLVKIIKYFELLSQEQQNFLSSQMMFWKIRTSYTLGLRCLL